MDIIITVGTSPLPPPPNFAIALLLLLAVVSKNVQKLSGRVNQHMDLIVLIQRRCW